MGAGKFLALAVLAAVLFACSESSVTDCQIHTDCGPGLVCERGSCVENECDKDTDCFGQQVFCAPPGLDPDNPDKRLCSPKYCDEDTDCLGLDEECSEYKTCIPKKDDPDWDNLKDIEPTDSVGFEDTKEPPPVPWNGLCIECDKDTVCPLKTSCRELGKDSFCLPGCEDNNDCQSGWICNPLAEERFCVPMSMNCKTDCMKEGCPEGKRCNQITGKCGNPVALCEPCGHDWDCQEDQRCYNQGSYCAPVCGTGIQCPFNSFCQADLELGAQLCLSTTIPCCYGETCDGKSCQPPTPYVLGNECVQCILDPHCPDAGTCGADHKCIPFTCDNDPTHPYVLKGKCVECLEDYQCDLAKGEGWTCSPTNSCLSPCAADADHPYMLEDKCVQCLEDNHCKLDEQCVNNECKPGVPAGECGVCPADKPRCVQIGFNWKCVECTLPWDCPNGSFCDQIAYICKGTAPGCGGCAADFQCPAPGPEFQVRCDANTGCCYDANGWCSMDGGVACIGPGSSCQRLQGDLLFGLMPGVPQGGNIGACSCPSGRNMFLLLACIMPQSCSSAGCPSGQVCVDTQSMLSLMFGDWLGFLLPMGPGVCVNFSSLMGFGF